MRRRSLQQNVFRNTERGKIIMNKVNDSKDLYPERSESPLSALQRCVLEIESMAFESKQPDRGYTVKASYLKQPKGDALIEIFKDGDPLRAFLFPAYKVWNIAAHFSDIVDGEIAGDARGYEMAAWNGISNACAGRGEREHTKD